MKIAVVTSSPPFSDGGHLVIARALVDALKDAGHSSELVTTPQNRLGRQGAAYLAAWLTDLGLTVEDLSVDRVISLRYPAYAIRHPNHVCWLTHTIREYYDLWDKFSAPLSWKGRLKENFRRKMIRATDRHLLRRNVKRVFVISETVQARLQNYLDVESEVLYPPPPPRSYRFDEYGDYIFAVSRLTTLKRLSLLIEALARPQASGVNCVIAGEGGEEEVLRSAIQRNRLSDRVKLIGRIDDDALVDHLAKCRAVCFPPLDEDYGFVTVEAFASRKPVITCVDSGGPTELVHDGIEGFVCAPTPDSLASAISRIMTERALSVQMGEKAHAVAREMSWERIVKTLLR